MTRLERKQAEDQKKQAENLKRLEKKQAEDFVKMKSQLENKCKADMDKLARKHDEDIKQLKSDLESLSKIYLCIYMYLFNLLHMLIIDALGLMNYICHSSWIQLYFKVN